MTTKTIQNVAHVPVRPGRVARVRRVYRLAPQATGVVRSSFQIGLTRNQIFLRKPVLSALSGSSQVFTRSIAAREKKSGNAIHASLWRHPLVVRAFRDLKEAVLAGHMEGFTAAKPITSIHGYELPVWEHVSTGVRVISKYHSKKNGMDSLAAFIDDIEAGKFSGDGIVPIVIGDRAQLNYFELDLRGMGTGEERVTEAGADLAVHLGGRELFESFYALKDDFGHLLKGMIVLINRLQDAHWEHNHPHLRNWIVHSTTPGGPMTISLIDFTKLEPSTERDREHHQKNHPSSIEINDSGRATTLLNRYFEFIDLTSFKFTTLHSTVFMGCLMRDTNFDGQVLYASHFTNSDLSRADFSHAHFTRGSFMKCRLEGADFSGASFSRTIFDPEDLPYLATFFNELYVYEWNGQTHVTTQDHIDDLAPYARYAEIVKYKK